VETIRPMKFGIWYDFRNPEPWRRPWSTLYAALLDQIAWADSLGFDSVWLSEHHFTDEGYLPSVFPMLAALAERTSHMRLGTAVLLAPLHHPLRLAEDAAVVDQISNGRLELGLAPGYRPEEFGALGVPRGERGSRTDETIEILKLAWSSQPFSFQGKHFQFHDVTVAPPPAQQPHPPIWIGGSSPASARRAATFDCNYMPDSGASPAVYERYRDALHVQGHDGTKGRHRIATNRIVYVCDDPEQGWRDVGAHYLYVYNRYRDWFAAAGDFPELGGALESSDSLSRELHWVGTPQMIVTAIRELQQRVPIDTLIFWAHPPGLDPDKSSLSLELFAKHVLPNFANTSVAHSVAPATPSQAHGAESPPRA
jgi:probable F420-dependent oxidoreductase